MPAADDLVNLDYNLNTLVGLSDSPPGSKLAFDRRTGRFSIQKPGKLQRVARTLSHDTVTSQEDFGRPIRAVFSAAYPNGVPQNAIFNAAINGLRSLRQSYTGDKLAALNAVISDAEHGVNKDPRSAIRLREKYRAFVIFGFSQSMFLPTSNPGVCYSFSIDWARRILHNKETFAVTKKPPGALEPTTPNAAQKGRMMKKVDSRIRAFQAGLNQASEEYGERPRNVLPMVARQDRAFAKYGTLGVYGAEDHPQGIAHAARGSGVLAAVRTAAARDFHRTRVFVVNFKYKDKPGGHAIGIHFPENDAFHFFDPNIGEFEFPNGADEQRNAFLDDWWKLLYIVLVAPRGEDQGEQLARGQGFETWQLEGVQLRPQAGMV